VEGNVFGSEVVLGDIEDEVEQVDE